MSKMYFIIWSCEDGPVRVEETNPLLKTYTQDASPPKAGASLLSLRGFPKGSRGNLPSFVIASPLKAGVAISLRNEK